MLNISPSFLLTMVLTKMNIGKLNATIKIDQLILSESKKCVIVASPPTPPGANPLLFWKK